MTGHWSGFTEQGEYLGSMVFRDGDKDLWGQVARAFPVVLQAKHPEFRMNADDTEAVVADYDPEGEDFDPNHVPVLLFLRLGGAA